MGLREETRKIRIREWTKVFEDKNASGLTAKQYCEEHNIGRDAYFYWLKIVRESALANSGTTFAELIPPTKINQLVSMGASASAATISIGNATIAINNPEMLKAAMEVILYAE